MKISYNWLQEYFIGQLPEPIELANILTSLGLEVEKTTTIGLSKDYLAQFIIAEVKEVTKHPNADKLKLVKVYTGADTIDIVCGAPNLFQGQRVVLAPIGSILKVDNTKTFKIKKSNIRGHASCGMLCSEAEIGISSNHDEIISLSNNAQIGSTIDNYYDLQADAIFEIAITPNRGDVLSYMGLAKDLNAKLNIGTIFPKLYNDTDNNIDTNNFPININIKATNDCHRYLATIINGIEVLPSPKNIQSKLATIGVNTVNNIVDIANLTMFETGQPVHAFDLDLIKNSTINVRPADKNETILTLDSKEKKLDESILLIADSKNPLCIAGLIGGSNSGINKNTKNILLEFANFNPETIRRATKKYNLVTDSAFRFERYVDPNLADIALKRMLYLLQENHIINKNETIKLFDYYPNKVDPKKILINLEYVNSTIGINIPKTDIINILKLLDFNILEQSGTQFLLTIPTTKADIKQPVDVVEEIIRIYGYDNIQIPNKLNYSTRKNYKSEFIHSLKNNISSFLTDRGYYEVINNSLTKNIDLNSASTKIVEAVQIENPLSQDLNSLRTSLLAPMMENISYNKRRQKHDIKIYEIGHVYSKNIDYSDSLRLSIAITGAKQKENWSEKRQQVTFFSLKGVLESLLMKLDIATYQTHTASGSFSEKALIYNLDNRQEPFAVLGEVKDIILKHFAIKSSVFFVEVNLSKIIDKIFNHKTQAPQINSYPSIRRDLSLLLEKNISYCQLVDEAKKVSTNLIRDINIFDVYAGDKMLKGQKSYSLSFTFQSNEKTLSDKEVEKVMNDIIKKYESIGINIRSN
ncbi:MAG: phenylalanine--tRNA ligase subunit beta [Solitalea-like symbiont of Tyrophagus putrescentiae]